MTKVLTIVGTRPEIIRLSKVLGRLDASVDHVLVHTGQNYDYELNGIFFEELGVRKPDHFLEVDTSSLGLVLGETLIKTEAVLRSERPDAVLILGDTNSCIAGVMAKRMRIPLYHMEAGNRCFDENVPEETNRRIIDHTADFNLVYTEHARRNLLSEGIHPRRILKTGSPMNEVLAAYRSQILQSPALSEHGLSEKGYLLVSAHREENVDSPARLRALLECLTRARDHVGLPVFMSTHPRTRSRLMELSDKRDLRNITFSRPLGFLAYNRLQLSAACVLSDSGTIAEESSMLGFPAITLRDAIERPEALDSGSIIMTGLCPRDVETAITFAMGQESESKTTALPSDYEISNTSVRVVNFILSTAGRHRAWAGLRS